MHAILLPLRCDAIVNSNQPSFFRYVCTQIDKLIGDKYQKRICSCIYRA